MVNDVMVCMDRIITSTSSSSSSSHFHHHHNLNVNVNVDDDDDKNNGKKSNLKIQKTEKVAVAYEKEVKECRICQDEDDHHSLESPCACNGTLKFAHRICIQKWCNKKGDITCEICNQVFTPNYSLPPPRPNPDVMAVDISQMWGHHFGLREHHLLALAAAERQLLDSEYDEYGVANFGNISCLRSIAIILMFVLLIHQVLIISRDFGLVQGYSAFFHTFTDEWSNDAVTSFLPSNCWFSSTLLRAGPLMVYITYQEEEAGLIINTNIINHSCM